MVDYPKFDARSPQDFITLFKEQTIASSAGRLSDFGTSSALLVLAEAYAALASSLLIELNDIFPAIVASSLSLLGATRSVGTKAIGQVRFQLSGVFPNQFEVPRGYRFSIGAAAFQTSLDLIIPSLTDTANPNNYPLCTIGCEAIDVGSGGNQSPQQCGILYPLDGLASLWLDQATTQGKDEESLEEFADRVQATIGRTLDDISTAEKPGLITAGEFERAAIEVLGSAAIVVAVPNLAADKITKLVPALHLFGLNPDYSPLTAAQIRSLSEELNPRSILLDGRIFISSLNIYLLKASVYVSIVPTASIDTVAGAVRDVLTAKFNPSTTKGMGSLDLYSAVAAVYGVEGITTAKIRWAIGTDAEEAIDLTLGQVYTVAKFAQIRVVFDSGITRVFS